MVDAAVGVADDARETSQGAGVVRMAGDAGLRNISRSRVPPLSVKTSFYIITRKYQSARTFIVKNGLEYPVEGHTDSLFSY